MRPTPGKRQYKMSDALSIIPVLPPIEAQRLSGMPPLIRAQRPKFPHPVYEIMDYRMRYVAEDRRGRPRNEISDEQKIQPRRFCLSSAASGDY
jgi:hypothetical protein